jgi:polar amino acid transport system substrate-binding protein
MNYFHMIKSLFCYCGSTSFKINRNWKKWIHSLSRISLLVIIITLTFFSASKAKDLIVSIPYIAGISEMKDGKSAGVFVDIYLEMQNHYKDGKIFFSGLYPFKRSVKNVITGEADFHFPMVRSANVNQDELPYYYVPEEMGKIAFVLYTHSKKEELDLHNMGKYTIEVLRGHKKYFDFNVIESNSIEQSLKKIQRGRTDGLIHAQESTDAVLRKNKIKEIRRELFTEFDSCIIVAKNENGAATKRVLSELLRNMKKDKSLYKYVGKGFLQSYNNWQPSKMGW